MAEVKKFRLPSASERVAVIGRTGSGKTRMGAWLLSHAPFHKIPYVVINFKNEELFDGIDRLHEIDYNSVPKQPGLYQLSPRVDEDEKLEAWMWKVWERGRTGLYFDETLQVPGHYKPGAFRALLTQGRSKRIPCIMATQRPSGVSPNIFSEADHFAVFHLNRLSDIQRVEQSTSDALNLRGALPEFHSRWYDVKRDALFHLAPVESDDVILERFNDRLRSKTKFL